MKRTSEPRRITSLSESVQRRLNSYALAASAAGATALALSPTANAKIIYTSTHDKVVLFHPFALDLNHDGIADFYLNRTAPNPVSEIFSACQYLNTFVSGTIRCASTQGMNAIRTIDSKGRRWGAALNYGEKIQPGKQWVNQASLGRVSSDDAGIFFYNGPWFNKGKGVKNRYLGLKFKIEGHFHFGWARITIGTGSGFSFTAILTGYAYETIPGKAIIAGATKGPDDEPTTSFNTHAPQPATLGILALGAPGLSIWKREESAGATTERN
jgi:hypothetical protein